MNKLCKGMLLYAVNLMFFKQLKRDNLSEGRRNKKRKVDAAEEVAVDDDLAVIPVDICSSALFAGIGDSVLLPSGTFHFMCCITSQNSSVWLFGCTYLYKFT